MTSPSNNNVTAPLFTDVINQLSESIEINSRRL